MQKVEKTSKRGDKGRSAFVIAARNLLNHTPNTNWKISKGSGCLRVEHIPTINVFERKHKKFYCTD